MPLRSQNVALHQPITAVSLWCTLQVFILLRRLPPVSNVDWVCRRLMLQCFGYEGIPSVVIFLFKTVKAMKKYKGNVITCVHVTSQTMQSTTER